MANTKISALPAVATPASTDQFAVNQGGVSKKVTLQQIAGASGNFNPAGTSRIQVNSTTQIQLNIGVIPLLVNSIWQTRAVTAAVTISNGGLAANTTYFVYAFDSAGTLTLEIVTTAHVTDATYGVEIKSGDATRTLVGMIRTNASTQFVDSTTQRFAVSWFNQRYLPLRNRFTAARTTTSTTFVELNTEIRIEYLVWPNIPASLRADMWTNHDTNGNPVFNAIGIDGTTPGTTLTKNAATFLTGLVANPSSIGGYQVSAEGYHFATLLGRTSTGTGSWAGGADDGNASYLVGAVQG